MPNVSSCGLPSLMTLSAISTTAPSTQPPETMPEISPRSLMAIFDPGGRGAERRTPTTVASATWAPSATQRSTSLITSFIASSIQVFPGVSSPIAWTAGAPGALPAGARALCLGDVRRELLDELCQHGHDRALAHRRRLARHVGDGVDRAAAATDRDRDVAGRVALAA